jgi:hypothetical protein
MATEWGTRPSNGTMGDMLRAQLCARCTVDHDAGWHPGGDEKGEGCEIMLRGLIGEDTPEWGYDLDTGIWQCKGFAGPCACDGAS